MKTCTPQQCQDAEALLQGARLPNRRTALKAALGVGYVAAARPVVAQNAIRTPAQGLLCGEVTIEVDGFKMPVYRSAPEGKTGLPVVLVVSEIFGVHEYIADVTRRLAHLGYLAMAPDLFARHGDPEQYGEIAKIQSEIIAKVPDAQLMGDLDACMVWAGAHGGDLNRLGITGMCWGGRTAWLYAQHQPRLKAAVVWYGRLQGELTPNNPSHPLDQVAQLQAPVLGLYGGADVGIPQSSVEAMKAALAQGNAMARASEIVVYPDTPHAFHADYRPSYRQGPAEDGWRRLQAWFKRHGV